MSATASLQIVSEEQPSATGGGDTDRAFYMAFLNGIFFLVYAIPASLMVISLKFRLDRSALYNICLYTSTFFARCMLWLYAETS